MKKALIGFTLIAAAFVLTALALSGAGECASRYVGKAVWYAPYAALVTGVAILRPRLRARLGGCR